MVSSELREINFSADNSCFFSHTENIYFKQNKTKPFKTQLQCCPLEQPSLTSELLPLDSLYRSLEDSLCVCSPF